jgi:uncharacterized protein (TIGR01777 family)
MKVFITGGTGFVGNHLTQALSRSGHEVMLLSRSPAKDRQLPTGASLLVGDPNQPGAWQQAVAECGVAINLAGSSIFTHWNAKAKQVIRQSRIATTRYLVAALAARQGRETLLISASAIGYYGGRDDDQLLDEDSPPGADFLAQLARDWEAEAQRAESFGVRVVRCRFGIVLGSSGGTLSKMTPAFRSGLGSPLGSGRQWFSWIHERDLTDVMLFLLARHDISGPVNCATPFPVRNRELSQALAKALHRPLILPAAPAFLVRMVLGEFGDVVLKGQRVYPKRLLSEGFEFRFPTLQEALADLIR